MAALTPPLAALERRLAALPDDADGLDRVAAAQPLLDDIGWLRALVAEQVARLRDDPWWEPPFRTLPHGRQSGLVLWDGDGLRLSVARIGMAAMAAHKAAPRRSIAFTGQCAAWRVLAAGGAVLGWWETVPAGSAFTAAGAPCAWVAGETRLVDGRCIAIDGRRRAWTLAHQTGDVLLLQAAAAYRDAPLAPEHDAATGALLSVSATDDVDARLQLMASTLRALGPPDAAPALAAAAGGGPFFHRWHLLRELAGLDPAAAAAPLRLAARDPHPELAAAAAAALRLLPA